MTIVSEDIQPPRQGNRQQHSVTPVGVTVTGGHCLVANNNDRSNDFTTTFARRLLSPALGAATALALLLAAPPSQAQDAPWGGNTPMKKKPAKKKPVAKKTPAKKKPVTKKAAVNKKTVTKKTAAKKKTVAKKKPAAKVIDPFDKKSAAKKPGAKKPLPIDPFGNQPEAKKPAKLQRGPAQQLAGASSTAAPTTANLMAHFHDVLSPYGKWQPSHRHGLLWVPNPSEVGKNFAPYRSNGRWALTKNRKWAWASNYKWGAVPFHYGRWVPTRDKQWAWVPGTKHAPAWVQWRVADNGPFVGWAPMPPATQKTATNAQGFNYVPTRYVFNPQLQDFVINDKNMAKKLHGQSHVLSGGSAAAPGQAGATQPPSPTLAQVPSHAVPRLLLNDDDSAIAPISADNLRTASERKQAQKNRIDDADAKATAAVAKAKRAQAAADAALAQARKVAAHARTKASAAAEAKAQANAAIAARDAARAEAEAAAARAAAEQQGNDPGEESRFATPPREGDTRFATPPDDASSRKSSRRTRARVMRMKQLTRRRRVMRRARHKQAERRRRRRAQRRAEIRYRQRARRALRRHDSAYRCGWDNNVRPRQWRCGPTGVTPQRPSR